MLLCMGFCSRRRFLKTASSLAALTAAAPLHALGSDPKSPAYRLVASTDHDRILRNAKRWAGEAPRTIVNFPKPAGRPGGPHDYVSDSDYFWPDPNHPDGPYRERDGESNPTNFNDHRLALIRLSLAMPALTAGFVLTGRKAWGRAAAAHLRAWFVAPGTHMNPNLQYAQGVRNGGPTGRQYGIIDTLHLAEVARATPFVREFVPPTEYKAILDWFREYLEWMNTSVLGIKERDGTNNHGIAWALQAAEFSRLVGDESMRQQVRDRWHTVQLPMQMAADGSFPRETARTKPYGYSIFTFDVAAALAWSLGGETEERFALPDGRGMCRAAEFLEPFLANKASWPFRHDVQHWESWPVRSPGLLFTGLACAKPAYLDLWKKLDPDPADPEVIRNFPVRQPLLWL